MNSGKKDDRGTIVIEMCIIMPIVITVIFVVINMMIVQPARHIMWSVIGNDICLEVETAQRIH